MNDLEYIDDYFTGRLTSSAKRAFELRCKDDLAFAEQVGQYVVMRQQLHQQWYGERKQEFQSLYTELTGQAKVVPMYRNWIYYAAAACVVFALVFFWMQRPIAPSRYADHYIEKNFSVLPPVMSGNADSLQMAVAAFNEKDYERCKAILFALQKNVRSVAEATEYLGITYLVTGNYEKAIDQFQKLASYTELHTNPGKFYSAVALLRRSEPGDVEDARAILNEVVGKKLTGHAEAKTFLEKL